VAVGAGFAFSPGVTAGDSRPSGFFLFGDAQIRGPDQADESEPSESPSDEGEGTDGGEGSKDSGEPADQTGESGQGEGEPPADTDQTGDPGQGEGDPTAEAGQADQGAGDSGETTPADQGAGEPTGDTPAPEPGAGEPSPGDGDAGDPDQGTAETGTRDGGEDDHATVVRVDTSGDRHHGGIGRRFAGGVEVGSLDGRLKLDYLFRSTDCSAGSPRLALRVDEDDDGNLDRSDRYAFGYIGEPPDFRNCGRRSWERLDLTAGSAERWDLGQLGGPAYGDWNDAKDLIDGRRVFSAIVVHDDSDSDDAGVVLFDNVTLGERTFTSSL
jgi:hypothetical protein